MIDWAHTLNIIVCQCVVPAVYRPPRHLRIYRLHTSDISILSMAHSPPPSCHSPRASRGLLDAAWRGCARPSVAGRAPPSRIRYCSDCPPRQQGGNMLVACRERGVRRRRLRGKRSAQRQCRGMGVGHLDTFHLPGYAVGPFLVTNSDSV